MPRARRDLSQIFRRVDAPNSQTARKWYKGLKHTIQTLSDNPNRCPVTPESPDFRHLLYGDKPHVYRVIYRVAERRGEVEILHIRHGAMDRFEPDRL